MFNSAGGDGGTGGGAISDGGSSAMGSSNYIAKPSGTNADGTTAYASATSITVTGLSFLFSKFDIKSVVQIPTSGESTVYDNANDFVVTGTIGSQTITIANASFAASDDFTVLFNGDKKAYDKTIDALRVASVLTTAETILDESITSAPTGTASYYFSMDDLTEYCIDFIKTGGTDTVKLEIFASNDSGVSHASKTYQNITQYGHGISTQAATAASYTDTDVRTYKVEGETMTAVRVDVTIAGGTNDAGYDLVAKVQ